MQTGARAALLWICHLPVHRRRHCGLWRDRKSRFADFWPWPLSKGKARTLPSKLQRAAQKNLVEHPPGRRRHPSRIMQAGPVCCFSCDRRTAMWYEFHKEDTLKHNFWREASDSARMLNLTWVASREEHPGRRIIELEDGQGRIAVQPRNLIFPRHRPGDAAPWQA